MFPAKAETGQRTARHTTTNALMIFSKSSIRHSTRQLQSKGRDVQLDWAPRKHTWQTQEFSDAPRASGARRIRVVVATWWPVAHRRREAERGAECLLRRGFSCSRAPA